MDEKPCSGFWKKIKAMSEDWLTKPLLNKTAAFIMLLLMLLTVMGTYLFSIKAPKVAPKSIPVVVGKVISKDVPIYIYALGTVTPQYTVTLRTQINGLLMKVLFKEGELVKKGQLLAQIDSRPYEALLAQYEGNLKRDLALLANAKVDLKRYQQLWKENSISQQILATQQALVEQYEGTVKTDLGLIQSTKINLIYCNITSPIEGRIGLRLVDAGNYIQASDTQGIAVIATHDPMTVIFPVAEDFVQQILPQAYTDKPLTVQVFNRQKSRLLGTGKLLALDSQISTLTGTVKLRALFDNKKFTLFPNQFVNVNLLVDTLKQATLVPTSAIQHTTTQDFVYLLKKDNTVATTRVTTGPLDGEYTVIKRGLKPGQAVVINGADKLTPGALVRVQKPNKSVSRRAS